MAAISPHPAPAAEAARAPGAAAPQPLPRAPAVLAALLLAACAYAAFARGATRPGDAAWLHAGVAAVALLAGCMAAAGAGVRARTSRAGAAGLALLAILGLWTALTILWSVAPDRTWLQANRVLSYVLVAGLGVALGTSLPRALTRATLGGLVLVTAVALYALGGKVLPGLSIGGVLDLDHTALSPRLRAPLGYANALALVVAAGIPLALVTWADPARRRGVRLGALAAGLVCACVLGMTYSRGGIIALACALVVLLALAGARGRLLAGLGLIALCAVPVLAVAFGLDGLTDVAASRDARKDDGLVLLGVLAAAMLLALAAGRALLGRERRAAGDGDGDDEDDGFGDRGGSRAAQDTPRRSARGRWWIAPAAAGAMLLAVVLALAVSDRGVGGSLSDAADPFRAVRAQPATQEPGHLLSTSSDNRWSWWGEALGAWGDRPVAGWGAGSFPVTHLQYRETTLAVAQPHSVPLQLLAETGLVGLVLFAGAFGLLLAAAVGRLRALPDGRERRAGAVLAAVAVAWLVHGLVEWHWDIPGVTLPAVAALGLLAARPGWRPPPTPAALFEDPEAARRHLPRRALAVAVGVVALSLVALSGILPGWADGKASGAQEAANDPQAGQPELLDAAAQAELAARLDPVATRPLFAAAAIAQRRGRLLQARELLLQAVLRQPEDAGAWRRLTRVAVALADLDGAVRASRRALALDPRSPEARRLATELEALRTPPSASATATATPLNTTPGAAPIAPPVGTQPAPQPDLDG